METPIQIMYNAAKVEIPAEGDYVSRISNHLRAVLSVMDVQSAHAGEPPALTSMLHVGGDMLAVLQNAVTAMDNCSAALIATANDYVATDDQARADFEAMGGNLKDLPLPSHQPNPLPNPEAPGAEVPGPPFPGPPGGTVTVDPNADPQTPDDEREDRGDGGDDQPDVPGVDRDWDD